MTCFALFIVELLALKVQDEEAKVLAEAEDQTFCAVALHQRGHERELAVLSTVSVLQDVLNLCSLEIRARVEGMVRELGRVGRPI